MQFSLGCEKKLGKSPMDKPLGRGPFCISGTTEGRNKRREEGTSRRGNTWLHGNVLLFWGAQKGRIAEEEMPPSRGERKIGPRPPGKRRHMSQKKPQRKKEKKSHKEEERTKLARGGGYESRKPIPPPEKRGRAFREKSTPEEGGGGY